MTGKTTYRLGASTVAEPLINKWAAWSHLVPPVPASLHLKRYQMALLRSYLADPRAHAMACLDPKLRSGRFVDIPEHRAAEVEQLLAETEMTLRENLVLADCVIEFQNYLASRAKGESLDPYYDHLPDALRGYVELMYDYYNHPIARFIESLLYESRYFKKEIQSLRIFQQKRDNSRPFIMNTPRLSQTDQIDWSVPFDSPATDEFFKLESVAQPLGYIRELLGLHPSDESLLLPLLTEEGKPPREECNSSAVRVRYLGHACVLVEYNGVSVLTDPVIGVMPSEGGIERFTYDDLPEKIDYVVITHNHHDHFSPEALLRLRHRTRCLVVPRSFGIFYGDISLKLLARKIGFKNVVELENLETIDAGDVQIISVPFMGEHADLPHSKTAYVVRAGGQQILFGADSDCLDPRMYERLRRILGPVETVFLGMECVGAPLTWSCGPFFPVEPERKHEQSRRYKGSDSTRAISMLQAIGATRIFVYAMGLEPWFESLLGLAYAPDALQIKEASRLLAESRRSGFEEARLLSGRCDLYLPARASHQYAPAGDSNTDREPDVALAGDRQAEIYEAAEAAMSLSDDSEDQFIFDS